MPKTRISISLDSDQAERIRAHAERAGMDVSAYLANAATQQMAEAEAAEAQFAQIDAAIVAAEAAAADLPPLADVADDDLTEAERREVREAMELVYGPDSAAARPGSAA
ncbi:diphthamide synthase (EF-2-diphthine--ammonia ligase) [Kitasatospora sp. GAS204A]|uniref:ribbon-helix-helix protein, CopG family n=1 Tax=unclassified Kitasatospora TaxID=2633591 RepID=UPI002474383B|nr:ribbon-helix-helix protein, CopG family [Kitasatospora sp. GAS204B]MDH6118574.1 diphthamide synthase (EF-2-diphthine--ammonia ligase) [Kitasatospora sp. GAS204B]